MPVGLELIGVGYAYEGAPALRGIDLCLDAGRVTTIVGANGSGKSTLLDLVADIRQPHTGVIRRTHLRRPAFVPQASATPDELPLTVRDCVTVGRYARAGALRPLRADDRAQVAAAMQAMDIAHLADRRMRDLSGGQRQRTLIAQGLVQQGDLLVLDEPDSAIDDEGARLLHAALAAAAADGATVVVATHAAGFPADRVVRLDAGSIIPVSPDPLA